jgi:hypothetical protein
MVPVRGVLLLSAAAWLSVATRPPDQLPAFPGAEGFGSRTPGGRGGRAIAVTTLADSGPGSFRAAVTAPGPRVVVFAVGGLITLRSPIDIKEPWITVAGQTAPGDGICLRGSQVSVRTHDVVLRHLRFRPGDVGEEDVDSLDIMDDSHDVVIDHCSTTWSIDENLSPSGGVRDVTVQWCLIAEALNRSHHSKGEHGYGSLVRAVGGVSLHHNLWAHNIARNPRLGDNYGKPPYPTFDVRNNVIYDYGKMASGLTGDRLNANYVGNYVRPGPSSDRARGVVVLAPTADAKYFVRGNVVEHRPDWTADNARLFDQVVIDGRRVVTAVDAPFDAPPVHTTDATTAFEDVLRGVGATLPARDAVDARIVRQVREGTGSVIDSQEQVGGWPEYRPGAALPDADGDGMPDAWERAKGLNPADASDGPRVGADGYTNLEGYLNQLVASRSTREGGSARGNTPASAPSAAARPRREPAEGGPAWFTTWKLDNLSSIEGHAVTVLGAPRVVQTRIGPAIEFDGVDDGLLLDVNPIAGMERFTIEAVVEPAADGPAEQRFVHLSEQGSENRAMLETRILPGAGWCLDTYLRHDPGSLTLIDRSRVHPAGVWHAVALVYDGVRMAHFVDGALDAEGQVRFAPIGAGRVSIGVRQNRVSWFKGRIALVRITAEALPPERLLRVASK